MNNHNDKNIKIIPNKPKHDIKKSSRIIRTSILQYMLLQPQLTSHLLTTKPTLCYQHLLTNFLVLRFFELYNHLIAVLALFEQISLLTVLDVVFVQFWDLDYLVAIFAGCQISAIFKTVQIIDIGIFECLFCHTTVLTYRYILLFFRRLNQQQFLINNLLHIHCKHRI